MTWIREVELGTPIQQTADQRVRYSSQVSIGDYKQHTDPAQGYFDRAVIGAGTWDYQQTGTGATRMIVTSGTDAVIAQSYQWHNYYAGKPIKVELTASEFHAETEVSKSIGYYSSTVTTPFETDFDGFMFHNDGTELSCRIYRDGVLMFDKKFGDWDNQELLTNFDPEKFNLYMIDFLYLGGAACRFWVMTEYGLVKVAEYQHIGVDAGTFVKSPNQPIRYEIRSSGGNGGLNHICADVAVEGITSPVGFPFGFNMGATTMSSLNTATRYALLGVRHLTNGANYRNFVQELRSVSVVGQTADDLLIEIFIGGTLAGTPTWTPIPFTHMEGFAGQLIGGIASSVHSGGVRIHSGYLRGNDSSEVFVQTARRIGSFIDGTSEIMYLCVTPLTNNATVAGGINMYELV